jgi:dynein intermediate chain 1
LVIAIQAELAAAAEKESAGESSEPPDDSKQLRNSFNYSDRAAQTFNSGSKERETMTEPPPTATREGSCSQYEIYDEYVQDQRRIKHEEEVQKAKTAKNKAGKAATQETPGPAVQEEQQVAPLSV